MWRQLSKQRVMKVYSVRHFNKVRNARHLAIIERMTDTLAIPQDLATSLTLSPDARTWLSIVGDHHKFSSTVRRLNEDAGISKKEIVEDMTLLIPDNSTGYVAPRLVAKRDLLSPFGSQVEYCADLFDTSVQDIYQEAAVDLNILTPKYPTGEWNTLLRTCRVKQRVLEASLDDNKIREVVRLFKSVGEERKELLRHVEIFNHSVEDVAEAIELVKNVYEIETFAPYHVVQVSAFLHMGTLTLGPYFATPRRNRQNSRNSPTPQMRLLRRLGFSLEAIQGCSRILRFSVDQIESAFTAVNEDFAAALVTASDPRQQSRLINMMQYYIEKQENNVRKEKVLSDIKKEETAVLADNDPSNDDDDDLILPT